MLEAKVTVAIKYARRGWIIHRVYPPDATETIYGKPVRSPGKQPVDHGWHKIKKSPEEDEIRRWFDGGDWNIGLVCGEASAVTVIDLDREIYADIFSGVDTLRSARTQGRGHVFFRYNPRLKASKHQNLGIEVLTNGNQVVLPPSTHPSRDVYQWADLNTPLAEMPPEIETKLTHLFKREEELNTLVKKCRPCFSRLFNKKTREATDFHGAEGRELMVAWGADLKAAGATLADAEMWARILYGEIFDRTKTLTEWRNIDPAKTWKCETIARKLGGAIECDCDACGWKAPTAPAAAPKLAVEDALHSAVDVFTDYLAMAERMQESHPILYDRTRSFWIWSHETRCYHIADETDVLNAIKSATGIRKGVVTPAKSMILQAIKLTGRELEVADPPVNWIQFKNCVVDINTGEVFDATPEHFFTNPVPHDYGESEYTPTIDRLFTEWVGKPFADTLYEICAYCIYRRYPIHRIFVLLGSGRNGKGQFMSLVRRFCGADGACSTSLERIAGSRFEAAKLYLKCVAFIGETNFATIKNTAQLKALSGEDPIPGEFKNKSPFDFINHAKIIIATNSLPETMDKTKGYFSRWIIIDFPNEFDNGVPIIDAIPECEYENLCRKCVRILRDLLERGKFSHEGEMVVRERRYEEKSNPIKLFIDRECDVGENLYEPVWRFFERYDTFQHERKIRLLTKTAVSQWLKRQGYEIKQYRQDVDGESNNWKTIFGLKLKDGYNVSDMDGNTKSGAIMNSNGGRFVSVVSDV